MMPRCRGCARSSQDQGGAGHFKKAIGFFAKGTAMRFEFIARHEGSGRRGRCAGRLEVSHGGFYEWMPTA